MGAELLRDCSFFTALKASHVGDVALGWTSPWDASGTVPWSRQRGSADGQLALLWSRVYVFLLHVPCRSSVVIVECSVLVREGANGPRASQSEGHEGRRAEIVFILVVPRG